jgi:hypothetical protein
MVLEMRVVTNPAAVAAIHSDLVWEELNPWTFQYAHAPENCPTIVPTTNPPMSAPSPGLVGHRTRTVLPNESRMSCGAALSGAPCTQASPQARWRTT